MTDDANYFAELRAAWRPLAAATLGLGTGVSTVGTVASAIAPSLVRDNHWSPSQFALVGSFSLITSFAFPFVGRLADVIGVRLTALIGLVAMPLVYLAFSLMNGAIWQYMVLHVVQGVLCITTSSTVYTRLVVAHVRHARGLALAIAASGPAVTSIIGAPILNAYVETHGWEEAYHALAIFATMMGVLTFLLIPHDRRASAVGVRPIRRAREDYPTITRNRAFWFLLGAMLLCNLPTTLMLGQLKLLLLANGVGGGRAGFMLATMSAGTLAGRFIVGACLDRFRADLVSFLMMALPSIGLLIFASSFDAAWVLTLAVFCLGFAFGAEGDILAFLVAQHFVVELYGSIMGLLTFATSLSAALGATLLSIILASYGTYDLYLVISGFAMVIGATLLLALGNARAPATAARRPAPAARDGDGHTARA